MDLLIEDREILPDSFPINRTLCDLMHGQMWGTPCPPSPGYCLQAHHHRQSGRLLGDDSVNKRRGLPGWAKRWNRSRITSRDSA